MQTNRKSTGVEHTFGISIKIQLSKYRLHVILARLVYLNSQNLLFEIATI